MTVYTKRELMAAMGMTDAMFDECRKDEIQFETIDTYLRSLDTHRIMVTAHYPLMLLAESDYKLFETKFSQASLIATMPEGSKLTAYSGIPILRWNEPSSIMLYIPQYMVHIIDNYLKLILGPEYQRATLYDYKIVCDERNGEFGDIDQSAMTVETNIPELKGFVTMSSPRNTPLFRDMYNIDPVASAAVDKLSRTTFNFDKPSVTIENAKNMEELEQAAKAAGISLEAVSKALGLPVKFLTGDADTDHPETTKRMKDVSESLGLSDPSRPRVELRPIVELPTFLKPVVDDSPRADPWLSHGYVSTKMPAADPILPDKSVSFVDTEKYEELKRHAKDVVKEARAESVNIHRLMMAVDQLDLALKFIERK